MKKVILSKIITLRSLFINKVNTDWPIKWQEKYGPIFIFEQLKSQNAFLEDLLTDIEKELKVKIGLEETSKMLISKDNLRRIFNQSTPSSWQERTKNTLSYYVGFMGWEDFYNNYTESELVDKKLYFSLKPIKKHSKIIFIGAFIIFLSCFVYFMAKIYYFSKNTMVVTTANTNIHPSYTNVEIKLPQATFKDYNILLENERFQYIRNPNIYSISKYESKFKFLFFTPGYKKITLTKKGNRILEQGSLISTHGKWYGSARIKTSDFQPPNSSKTKNAWYGPMNQIANTPTNYLTTPEVWDDYLKNASKKIDFLTFPNDKLVLKPDYYNRVAFIKADNFNLNITDVNLSFKAKRANLRSEDCLSFMLQLYDEEFQWFEYYSSVNCNLNSNLTYSIKDNDVGRSQMNLHYNIKKQIDKTLEDFKWHSFNIIFINRRLKVNVDNSQILDIFYNPRLGKLKEILFVFEGNGALDDIKLVNTKTKKQIFNDDFLEP